MYDNDDKTRDERSWKVQKAFWFRVRIEHIFRVGVETRCEEHYPIKMSEIGSYNQSAFFVADG
jgi:hypothetical protein